MDRTISCQLITARRRIRICVHIIAAANSEIGLLAMGDT
jgi:hypothetical protein